MSLISCRWRWRKVTDAGQTTVFGQSLATSDKRSKIGNCVAFVWFLICFWIVSCFGVLCCVFSDRSWVWPPKINLAHLQHSSLISHSILPLVISPLAVRLFPFIQWYCWLLSPAELLVYSLQHIHWVSVLVCLFSITCRVSFHLQAPAPSLIPSSPWPWAPTAPHYLFSSVPQPLHPQPCAVFYSSTTFTSNHLSFCLLTVPFPFDIVDILINLLPLSQLQLCVPVLQTASPTQWR